jgi:hypothetical protein
MTVSKKQRTTLILLGCAVAAYFIYRWYSAKQSASAANSSGSTGQLGTNLNSVLTGLSAGPSTELNYYNTSTTTSTPVATGTGSSSGSGTGSSTGTGSSSGSGTGTTSPTTGQRWLT